MNWDAAGAIGEILGAIGVIVTLIYLSKQLRINSVEMRRQGQSDLTNRRHQIWIHLFEDPDRSELFMRGLDNELKNQREATQFNGLLIAQLYHYQDCMIKNNTGIMPGDLWDAEKKMLGSIAGDPGFKAVWPVLTSFFTPTFVSLIENLEHDGKHFVFNPESGEYHQTDKVPRTD